MRAPPALLSAADAYVRYTAATRECVRLYEPGERPTEALEAARKAADDAWAVWKAARGAERSSVKRIG